MNDESEVEEGPWRPYFRDVRPHRYWCGPLVMLLFMGFLSVASTISIFVMGYDPRPIDWGQYALYIVGTIAFAALFWTERQKRRESE